MRISRLFSPFLCTTFGLGLAAGSALAQAPALTALAPTRHQLAVPTGTSVAATFDQPLDNTAGTRAALKVFSSQRGGLLRDGRGGTATVSANTLSLAPTVAFRPGETVLTTLTPALTANGGSALARGRTASFTTAVSSTSPGLFRRLIPTGALNGPLDVAAADVDGDGDLDFLSSTSQNVVGVRFNNGTGTFSGSGSVNVGAFPVSMAVGDLDGDGDLDFVTANNSSGGKVSLRLNDGTGGFSGTVDVPVEIGRAHV